MPPARTSIWLHDSNVTASGKAGAVHRVAGALVGAALGVMIGVDMTNTGAEIGGLAFSQDFEAEADYVGVYHAARAGVDVSSAATLWRRLAIENPAAIDLLGSTHPSTAKRFLAIEAAMAEIEAKRAAGLPLVPGEREG